MGIDIRYSVAANKLVDELENTGVLSDQFKQRLIGLLLTSLRDAYEEGYKNALRDQR